MSNAKKILTFDDIQAANDVTVKTIDVPEWGGCVKIKSLSKRQMRSVKTKSENGDGDFDDDLLEQSMFIEGLVEPKITAEQYELLLDKSFSAMSRISREILELSNMVEDEKGMDAVTKEEKKFRPRR